MGQLILEYTCDGFESGFENNDGFITSTIRFENDCFIASPSSGPICVEGCSSKFQRR